MSWPKDRDRLQMFPSLTLMAVFVINNTNENIKNKKTQLVHTCAVILALRRLNWEDWEGKTSLGYMILPGNIRHKIYTCIQTWWLYI